MSQMPEQILLHKDEKYNTSDWGIWYDPINITNKELFNEDSRSNYVLYIPNYRIKELLSDACSLLSLHGLSRQQVGDFRDKMIKISLAEVDWNKDE